MSLAVEKSSNIKLQELTGVPYHLNLPKRQLLLYLPPQGQAASACWECKPGRTTEASSPGRGTGEAAAYPVSGEKVELCACPGCLDEFLLLLAQRRMCYEENSFIVPDLPLLLGHPALAPECSQECVSSAHRPGFAGKMTSEGHQLPPSHSSLLIIAGKTKQYK